MTAHGNDLGTYEYLVDGHPHFWSKPNFSFADQQSLAAPLLGICETGGHNVLMADQNLSRRIAFGPDLARFDASYLIGGSLFGWSQPSNWLPSIYANPYDDLFSSMYPPSPDSRDAEYLPGRVRLMGSPTYTHQMQAHFREIYYAAAMTNPNVMLAPLPIDCVRSSDLWDVEGAPRTVSVSYGMSDYPDMCAYQFLKPLEDTQRKILWVFAAGNESEHRCPASLRGRPNTLFVGALVNDQLGRIVSGFERVDIFAESNSVLHTRNEYGTSYAAPRVGDAAAQIAFDYPRFLPTNIRDIIMVSARQRDDLLGLSLSGGEIDFSIASVVVQCVADEMSESRYAYGIAPLRTCLERAGRTEYEADAIFRTLQERGYFDEKN